MRAVVIGIGATLAMDLWNLFLNRAFGIRSLNYRQLGRWIGHMPRGVFAHDSIATAAPISAEFAIGWAAHYSIGIALALGFVALEGPGWLGDPRLFPALAFGLATVVFPLFVMQPAIGLGIASSRSSHPWRARLKSVGTHLVFGVGLYAVALLGPT